MASSKLILKFRETRQDYLHLHMPVSPKILVKGYFKLDKVHSNLNEI